MPPGMGPNAGMNEQERQMVKYMQMGMESCLGKMVMSGVMGGGLGAMFGLFMASVSMRQVVENGMNLEGKDIRRDVWLTPKTDAI